MVIDLAPKAWAASTHWAQSRLVGLNTAGLSVPEPHSRPVNVFGPRWTSAVTSRRCQVS